MASSSTRETIIKKEPSISSSAYEPNYPLGEIYITEY
jgi:hypothetical protein